MNRREKTGFTLAELLIVVTIIAILVAVFIPVLSRHLERSKEAYDVHTMRQAASAAVIVYYQGIYDKTSAEKAGLRWWPNGNGERENAAGVYLPGSGTFIPKSSSEAGIKPYGKGTKLNGGTVYTMGNTRGAYSAKEDYTNAFVMVAIYPRAKKPHIDVYWKTPNSQYVGGQNTADDPKYSIRIYVD